MTVITEFAYQKYQERFNEELDQIFWSGYAASLYKNDRLDYDWQFAYYLHANGLSCEIEDLEFFQIPIND